MAAESWLIIAEDGELIPMFVTRDAIETAVDVLGEFGRPGFAASLIINRRSWGHRRDGWLVKLPIGQRGPFPARNDATDELWSWLREQFPGCSIEPVGK